MRHRNKTITRLKFAGPLLSGSAKSKTVTSPGQEEEPSGAIRTGLGLNYNSPVEVLCSELLKQQFRRIIIWKKICSLFHL